MQSGREATSELIAAEPVDRNRNIIGREIVGSSVGLGVIETELAYVRDPPNFVFSTRHVVLNRSDIGKFIVEPDDIGDGVGIPVHRPGVGGDAVAKEVLIDRLEPVLPGGRNFLNPSDVGVVLLDVSILIVGKGALERTPAVAGIQVSTRRQNANAAWEVEEELDVVLGNDQSFGLPVPLQVGIDGLVALRSWNASGRFDWDFLT